MTAGLIVALDHPDLPRAEHLARRLAPHVSGFKVGPTLFAAHGPEALLEVGQHGRVFCDLKLHDIPHQVEQAVAQLAGRGVWMTTVHASGGPDMIEGAVRGAAGECVVAAVTVLTSLDGDGVKRIGWDNSPAEQVLHLARLAVDAGAGAVVCSPSEVAQVRREMGAGVLLVVPGVRPAGSDPDDQRRVATPGEAAASGADHLVVGRPIWGARDPLEATLAILEELPRC
jgi:orotidine-5'-phosphate decarboxylase